MACSHLFPSLNLRPIPTPHPRPHPRPTQAEEGAAQQTWGSSTVFDRNNDLHMFHFPYIYLHIYIYIYVCTYFLLSETGGLKERMGLSTIFRRLRHHFPFGKWPLKWCVQNTGFRRYHRMVLYQIGVFFCSRDCFFFHTPFGDPPINQLYKWYGILHASYLWDPIFQGFSLFLILLHMIGDERLAESHTKVLCFMGKFFELFILPLNPNAKTKFHFENSISTNFLPFIDRSLDYRLVIHL